MFDVKVTYHIPETQAKKSQSLDQFPSRDIPPPHLSKDNTSNNNSFSLHCHKHSKYTVPFNTWDEAEDIPQFYDQILRTGARSAIYSNQCPQWNPLFYSIRNNWCQIWWFETPLGKAIFNNDNDDDVAYYLDLWQRKRKAMGEKKITLLTMSFWKPFEVTPSKNKLKNFCLFLFFPI